MQVCRNLLKLLPALLLLNAAFADVSTEAYPLRIKVLSAETHDLNGGTQVPKDCDLTNFSAYCNESRDPSAQNIMVVEDTDGKSFGIECITDSRWSRCAPLPVGETFEARRDKRGITVLYRTAKGKEKKQIYQLVAAVTAPPALPAGAAAETPPHAAAPPQNLPAPAPPPPASLVPEVLAEKVRCSFSSTPAGAEITVDGKYVGNTPSTIAVGAGTHTIVLSMPGFTQWKRELTVTPGSEVNVTASLQKTRP